MSQPPPDLVHDATRESFRAEVWERSKQMPVVVDFWAPWCAPCRQLGPVLERLAQEFAGKFQLVKANTDELPEYANEFGVSGIPAVYGVIDGQVVDFFQGALPEPALRQWLNRLIPSEAQQLVRQGESWLESDPAAAERLFRQASLLDGTLASAKIGLAQALQRQGVWDDCEVVVNELAARGYLEPAAEAVRAALKTHREAEQAGSVESCQAAMLAHPDRLDLRLQLARAFAGQGEYENALEQCLAVVQADRGPHRETARQMMIDLFRILPETSPLIPTYRRQLSTALY